MLHIKWVHALRIFGASFILIAFSGLPAYAASLTELQNQLQKAQSDLSHYQQLKETEQDKAEQYSSSIYQTQKQIQQVQATIANLQSNITQKEKDITTTSDSITEKGNQLNEYTNQMNQSIAMLYEYGNLTDVQFIGTSSTISDINDQSEYIQAVQQQMLKNIDLVTQARQDLESTKDKLEAQKQELAALKGQQQEKKSRLNAQQQETANLLSKAKANEAQYQQFVAKLSAQKEQLSAEIFTLRAQLSSKNKEVYAGGTSGYPYAAIDVPDAWGFYTRECTSYAAWKWNVAFGRPFYNTRPGSGDAWNWPALARDQGYSVSGSPRVGAIVSWPRNNAKGMPYGHVAIVEAVHGDGTIDVSEYNWNKYAYSYRKNVNWRDYGNASFITP